MISLSVKLLARNAWYSGLCLSLIHIYAEVPYFLICELELGFLDGVTGVYKDPEGYFVDEADVEAFDAHFPPRKKLKLDVYKRQVT